MYIYFNSLGANKINPSFTVEFRDSDISPGYGGVGRRRDVDSGTGWRGVLIDVLGCSGDVSGLARLSDLGNGGET